MKLLTIIVLAETGWLCLATTGPTWAYLLSFAGFILTPALAIEWHERSRTLAPVEYSNVAEEAAP